MSFSPSLLMIRIESLTGPVPVEAFLRAANEMSFVAAEVGRLITAPEAGAAGEAGSALAKGWSLADVQVGKPDETAIKARQPHSVALLLAPPVALKEAPQQVRQGVKAIASKCTERPAGFSDAALRALRRVAQNTNRKIRVSLSAGQGEGEAVLLDDALARHIDSWLNGQSASIGSVEGKLELISIHDRLRFTIYGRDGLRVECLFPETMLTQVKSALGERVCLRGRIRYRRDGKPATVDAQILKTLRPATQTSSLERSLEGNYR